MGNAALIAMRQADDHMSSAANAIASGPDGYVDASIAMIQAKLNVGIAAKLSRAQDEMMASTLDMFA